MFSPLDMPRFTHHPVFPFPCSQLAVHAIVVELSSATTKKKTELSLFVRELMRRRAASSRQGSSQVRFPDPIASGVMATWAHMRNHLCGYDMDRPSRLLLLPNPNVCVIYVHDAYAAQQAIRFCRFCSVCGRPRAQPDRPLLEEPDTDKS